MREPWRVQFFSPRLEQEVLALPPGLLARFLRYCERIEAHGPDLGMPHTRAMGKGLFELRLKAAEGIARVFYCTQPGNRIVVLHRFVKKSQRTPLREIETARQRMRQLGDD